MTVRWSGRTVAATAVAAAALALVAPVAADPASDKAAVDRQVDQAREALEGASADVAEAGAAVAAAEAQLAVAQEDASRARGALAAATAQRDAAVAAAAAAQLELDDAKAAFEDAQRRVEAAVAQVESLARAAFTSRSLDPLTVALSGDSPSDLPVRLQMIESVAAENGRILAAVNKERARLASRRSTLQARQSDLDRQRAEAEQLTAAASARAAEVTAAENAVAALVASRQGALDGARRLEAQERARVAELEAESARLSDIIRGAGGWVRPDQGGRLAWPTPGGVASGYGMRYHPILHYWRLHAGADIGGATGNPIWSADSGVVIWAGPRGGYGNVTMVDHGSDGGRSLVTVYAHQSVIQVRAGQRVARGQQIGLVGSTGLSTAPHLHFEVRLDGSPVDPVPWLQG